MRFELVTFTRFSTVSAQLKRADRAQVKTYDAHAAEKTSVVFSLVLEATIVREEYLLRFEGGAKAIVDRVVQQIQNGGMRR